MSIHFGGAEPVYVEIEADSNDQNKYTVNITNENEIKTKTDNAKSDNPTNYDVVQNQYLDKVYKVITDDDGKYTAQKASLENDNVVYQGGAYKKKKTRKTLKKKTKSNKKKRGVSRRK